MQFVRSSLNDIDEERVHNNVKSRSVLRKDIQMHQIMSHDTCICILVCTLASLQVCDILLSVF